MTDPEDVLNALDFEVDEADVSLEEDTKQLENSLRYILESARTLAFETYKDAKDRCQSEELALALAEVTFQFVLEYVTGQD